MDDVMKKVETLLLAKMRRKSRKGRDKAAGIRRQIRKI